jgi:hypothetical protein
MALIYQTTVTPSKLELLAGWLPEQSWYSGAGDPRLSTVGGFRLDDPAGAVGIEFMVVRDESAEPTVYQVPLSYRDAPLGGGDEALVGTTEHGVLGQRWVYDGLRDPVVVAQLAALIRGEVEAQAQRITDTPDPSVFSYFAGTSPAAAVSSSVRGEGPDGTDLEVQLADDDRQLIRVHRVLRSDQTSPDAQPAESLGHLTAGWQLPDGTETRGQFAVLL